MFAVEAGLLAVEAIVGPPRTTANAKKGGARGSILALAAAAGAKVEHGDNSIPYGW